MRMMAAKKAGSLLCLSLFVFLQALAVSPQLHRVFHHDANQVDHQCAVTLLSQGQLHIASSATPVVSAPVFVFEIPAHSVSAPVMVDYLLLPGRAPPSSTLS
jgi:hypothetical protein